MIYLREFELYESDGFVLAVPFGMDGGTFGSDLLDAVQSASNWLREAIIDDLLRGQEPEQALLGNAAQHGGRVIAISVDCDLAQVDAVSAADAARMLGVSTARVAQMCKSGKLASWKQGAKRMVLRRSIEARLEEKPKAGRPRKQAEAHALLSSCLGSANRSWVSRLIDAAEATGGMTVEQPERHIAREIETGEWA